MRLFFYLRLAAAVFAMAALLCRASAADHSSVARSGSLRSPVAPPAQPPSGGSGAQAPGAPPPVTQPLPGGDRSSI